MKVLIQTDDLMRHWCFLARGVDQEAGRKIGGNGVSKQLVQVRMFETA